MSCICEFHASGVDSPKDLTPRPLSTKEEDSPTADPPKYAEPEESTEPSVINSAVSASDLVDCRSENWLLRKKLRECEVTIENLEQLVSTLVEKQHQILSDMFILRTENHELQSECHLQREYHSMERNALLKQLNDAQALYQNRGTNLESRSNSRESPMNSGSSFVASSDDEDKCDSHNERESNSEEENENEDLSAADSLAPSSECSSPSPTCSESEDTDLEDEQSAEEDSSNSNSETD